MIQNKKSQAPTHAHPKYRPDIDGLRAIAVLGVVIYHAFPLLLPSGFIGVDVFFVISGFLIGLILLKSLQTGKFSFFDFYARRIRRIFPALLTVLTCCLIVGYFVLLPDEYMHLGKHTAAGAAFLANFAYWNESGYFDTAANAKPLLHLWSLAIEEQFYLFWPLVLWTAWRLKLNLLFITLMLLAISFAINVFQVSAHQVTAFFLLPSRAWELLAGTSLAWLYLYRKLPSAHNAAFANISSISGLILITAPMFWIIPGERFPGWYALLPVMGTALVLTAGHRAFLNRVILSSRIAVLIGLISYPLYLWHWPLLSFARIMEDGSASESIRIFALILSFVLSYLTYKLVESNVRHRRSRLVVTTIVATTLLVGSIGVAIYVANGIPKRTAEFNHRLEQFKVEPPELSMKQECKDQYNGIPYCMKSADRQIDTIIIGDSHARRLFPGLDRLYADKGRGILMLADAGCPPLMRVESGQRTTKPRCVPWMDLAFGEAMKENIKTVILSSRGPMYLTGGGFGSTPDTDWQFVLTAPDTPALKGASDIFKAGLEKTFGTLIKAGKNVVFVIDNPELGFHPMKCLDLVRPVRLTDPIVIDPCGVERSDYDERNKEYRSIIKSALLRFPGVKALDLSLELCDAAYCHAVRDGKMMYQDGDHLSVFGSYIAADAYVKQIFRSEDF